MDCNAIRPGPSSARAIDSEWPGVSKREDPYLLGRDLESQNPSGLPGPGISAGERRILESLHRLHQLAAKDDKLMITQAQFDTDLGPLLTNVAGYITAAQAASAAKDATIASLQAQLATATGTQPAPPDFTTEDNEVNAAEANLTAALAAIPTAPGVVTPTVTGTSPGVTPQFVKDAQAANAAQAPEQST
jgi:hypothetical protein